MDLLVGSTGFVGGNLSRQHVFTLKVHSSDVQIAYGTCPELCIYCAVPSAMYLANESPSSDLFAIKSARENLQKIHPKKLVLISTIAVYPKRRNVDEDSPINIMDLFAYGRNRYQLEQWVMEDFPDLQIIRLPALYGYGLKKNFLYDLHYIVPKMLKKEKYEKIAEACKLVKNAYYRMGDYYLLDETHRTKELRNFFVSCDYNALSFTDSRSIFQFYNLENLWGDLKKIMMERISMINLVTPPISAKEVYCSVTGKNDWNNELSASPYCYDVKTKYSYIFGRKDGYICDKRVELSNICKFMRNWSLSEKRYNED